MSNESSPLRKLKRQLPDADAIEALQAESTGETNLIYTFPPRLTGYFRAEENDAAPSLLDFGSATREVAFSGYTCLRNQVAIRRHSPDMSLSLVIFESLDEVPAAISADFLRQAGSERPDQAAKEFNDFATPHYRYSQGYCGWLLQQPEYWQDIESIVGLFGNDLKGELLPQQVFGRPKEAELIEDDDDRAATVAFKAFCNKWRLQGLTTLDLPVVVQPQLTASTIYNPKSPPHSVSPHIPDIFSVDAKGPFASVLESSRMGIDAPHLAEWKEIIGIKSRQKKKVDRYARQFSLQHYWGVLLQRYPKQTYKRKVDISEVFGKYFAVNPKAIAKDIQKMSILIDRKLSTFL